MKYLIGGNVMLDSVRFADGTTHKKESIGGPATFAYSGVKLFTDDVMQCSRVGEDYHSLFDPWIQKNGIETKGFKVVSERCNHSCLIYYPDGTYTAENFLVTDTEALSEWMQNLGYMKTSPQDFDSFTSMGYTKGVYLAQNCDRIFWDQLGVVKDKGGFKVMWEIEEPSAHFEFLHKILYASKYADGFSINLREAQNLFGVQGDEACIYELQKLPVDFSLFRVGERGIYVVTTKKAYYLPPAPGIIVDPTGCGNASTGAALYAYVEGYDPIKIGIMANVAAAHNIRQFGVIQDFGRVRSEAITQVETLYIQYREKNSF